MSLKHSNHLPTEPPPTAAEALKSRNQSKYYGAIQWQQQQPSQADGFKRIHHSGPPFRVAIGLMLVLASTLYHYAANSLAIVSVAMVVGDVRDRELTAIRTRHLALNPSLTASVASPGTCPIELNRPVTNFATAARPSNGSTAAELQLELEAAAVQVAVRLASGQLVDWTIGQRALMISAVSLGKLVCALPMGRLSYARGNHPTLLLSLLSAALLALLLPLTVCNTPFWFAFLFGSLTGGIASATEFVSYPLAAAWFLPDEASAVTGLLHISVVMGTTLTFFVSGELISNNLPWTWCFYLPGKSRLDEPSEL